MAIEEEHTRKKRIADRQITKDDGDDDENGDTQEQGQWKRASAEEMAKRRIVKAKRRGAIAPVPDTVAATLSEGEKAKEPFLTAQKIAKETSTSNTASANPFAGISFLNPAATENKENDGDKEAKKPDPSQPFSLSSFGSGQGGFGSVNKTSSAGFGGATATTESKETDKNEKPSTLEAKAISTAPTFSLGAFGQKSPGFGAFGNTKGGFGGFGSAAKAGTETKTEPSGFGAVKGEGFSSSLKEFAAPEADVKAIGSSKLETTLPMTEKTVTGEENEESVFDAPAVLYEYGADNSWKEKGKGQLHLNAGNGKKARLVMRASGSKRLILNANLWPEMVVTIMDGKKGVTFACLNHAGLDEDQVKEVKPSTLAIRMKSPLKIEELVDSINKHLK